MESNQRIRRLRPSLGCLLATPGFGTVPGIVEDVSVTSYCNGVVGDVIMKALRKKIAVSRDKEAVCEVLHAFASHVRRNGETKEMEHVTDHPAATERVSSSYSLCQRRYKEIERDVMKKVVSDIEAIFHVSIKDAVELEELRKEGLYILRRVTGVGGQQCIAFLFPPLFICAVASALVLNQNLKLYGAVTDEMGSFKDVLDETLGIWLHVFNSGVVEIRDEGDEEGRVSNWVAYIVGCRHLFFRSIPYIWLSGVPTSPEIPSELSFREVDHSVVLQLLALVTSLRKSCGTLMREYYYPSVRNGSFQHLQAELDEQFLALTVFKMGRSAERGSDLGQVQDLLFPLSCVYNGCRYLGKEWPIHVAREFELSSRSGRFEKSEIFDLTAHLLVCVSVGILFQTDLFLDVYEDTIEAYVLNLAEELLE